MTAARSTSAPARAGHAEVVIAGGGVAALEALIALHDLAPPRVHVTLVAPGPDFVYRPLQISEPFGLGRRTRHPLARAASDFDAAYVAGTVDSVDPAAGELRCAGGEILRYDSLILALGAHAVAAFDHAETIADDASDDALHGIRAELEQGGVKRLAFIAPGAAVWSLPLYELAVLTADEARSAGIDDLVLFAVSAEERPLGLFGPEAAQAVERLLERHGIEFIGASRADVRRGEIVLAPGERHLQVDRCFALPLLHGPRIEGVPADEQGFIPVDTHGRVQGLEGVFAAGDVTAFPVKQGGLAAQQAEAAAQAVAARHGCALEPEPFRPVLRGRLMTADDDLFLRYEIAGGGGEGAAARHPLWWPPTKIAARRLAPYLFGARAADQIDRAGSTGLTLN